MHDQTSHHLYHLQGEVTVMSRPPTALGAIEYICTVEILLRSSNGADPRISITDNVSHSIASRRTSRTHRRDRVLRSVYILNCPILVIWRWPCCSQVGMYLVTFSASIYVLIFQTSTSQYRPKKPLTLISMAIFLCVLTVTTNFSRYTFTRIHPIMSQHWVLDILRAFEAFIHHKLGDPAVYYADLSQGLNVAKATCYILETIVADVVLVRLILSNCVNEYQSVTNRSVACTISVHW